MAMRDFFKGSRDRDNDRWREQWRDDRYPQRYSSGTNQSDSRGDDRGRNRGQYQSQRAPQFYGQSGRSDWPDQRSDSRYARADRDFYGRDEERGGWNQQRDDHRPYESEQAPYHGGFYAGESGRESMYRTEPSGQGDWGRASQRWERTDWDQRDQQQFGRDDWRPFESREQGQHRGRGPKGYQRSDQRVHEEICECLTDDHYIDASNIEIEVQAGVVTLTGTVHSRQEKRRAEDLIENLSGVKDVNNSLRVESSDAGTSTRQTESSATPSRSDQASQRQQTSRH